jgi:hypothetical protein
MSLRPRLSLVAALLTALVPATTFADSTGSAGKVDAVMVYESSSDEYNTQNGVVTVEENGGTRRDYRWGGTICAGRNVSSNSLQMLFDALRSQAEVKLTPVYKAGNGGMRCLTGFKLTSTAAAPPS